MASVPLPDSIQVKLDDLGARVRRLRLIRGVSAVVLTFVSVFAFALIADAWFELPPFARVTLFGLWVLATLGVLWFALLRRRETPAEVALAAAVEEQYPRLRERLTSSVELARHAEPCHGSPRFIQLLVRETDLKTRAMDFLKVAPRHATEWLGAGAIAAILILLAPAVIASDYYFGLGRRFLMPWDGRPAVLPYEIAVTPGTGYAAKGRPLTFAVELVPTNPEVTLPSTCTLVLSPANEKPQRLRMAAGDKPNTYRFRIDKLDGDLRYYVEAGVNYTDTHAIQAVEPVELADGSPAITATPPSYARPALEPQTARGLGDLAVLQHTSIGIDCQFTRPATGAVLLWKPAQNGEPTLPERQPLQVAADGLSGRVELPARAAGKIRLILEAEHGIRTELPTQDLIVTPDRPPTIQRLAGFAQEPRTVLASDTVPLDVTIADDLGVASAELEYRINDGVVQHEQIPLAGQGTKTASGQLGLKLAGRVRDGDTVQYRLRAADTRNIPELNLGPNVVVFPPNERWCELRVSAQAAPVREQEVDAQRDDIEKRLKELIARLDRAIRSTYSLRQDVDRGATAKAEQDQKLAELAEEQTTTSKQLADLAAETDMSAGLQPLADRIRSVARQEMRSADEAMQRAGATAEKRRVEALRQTDDSLTKAREKLEGLLEENRKLADARRDQAKVQDLADQERQLSERIGEAPTAEEKAKLEAEQQRLNDELKRLAEQSDVVRDALKAAQAEQARRLAEKAKELAQAERDLDKAITDAEKAKNAERFVDLARQQQELADRAKQLADRTRQATKAAKAEPLRPESSAKAADDLKAGDGDAAKRDQDDSAQRLDKLAKDLEKAIELGRDPREAALQLSRLQEANRQRLREQPDDRESLLREQEAIRQAAEKLPLGEQPSNTAKREQRDAAEQARMADDALRRGNQRSADARMQDARDALERLAKSLPTLDQRQKQARDEVAKLRKQQDDISAQTEKAAKASSPRQEQAETAKKQADLAQRLAKLDAANQDERKERARQATAAAADDLRNGRTADQAASQQDARRALERLEQALGGQTPADESARELARRERDLAAEAAKAGTDDEKRADLQRRQEQLTRDVQDLPVTEAPVRQGEAKDAVVQANKALRDQSADQAAPQLQSAAEKLEKLADQLSGKESNAERAERLAKRQEQAAADAEKRPANPSEARRQTTQTAGEANQVRGGDDAQAEKRQATDALVKAQRTPPGTPENRQAQRDAAQALRKLADKLNEPNAKAAEDAAREEAARRAEQQAADQKAGSQPAGMPNKEQVQQARDLARQQRGLQEQLWQMSGDSKTDATAQAAQQEIAKQTGELAKSLQQSASQSSDEGAKQSAEQAAQSAQQAGEAMDRAQRSQGGAASQARQEAAEALDRSGQKAEQAAQSGQRRASPNGQPTNAPSAEAGQSIEQAQGQMNQAQNQLGQGQSQSAQQSMQQAAQSLQRAAQQMMGQGQPGQQGQKSNQPSPNGQPATGAGIPQGAPHAGLLPKELQQYAGKPWGELPGELRTKILQDMKSQYGDDYARVIKLYFEQIAERK
ncbi:MAG TPA: hypothetical protein VL371_22470 [Gemmataceae bacterium]|nr:hypothetical protein [Gemmataceae bacterium]